MYMYVPGIVRLLSWNVWEDFKSPLESQVVEKIKIKVKVRIRDPACVCDTVHTYVTITHVTHHAPLHLFAGSGATAYIIYRLGSHLGT